MRAAGVRAGLIVVAALLAGGAHAQDNSTTVVPAPGIERYTLPPGNSQTTPTPTPTPTATLTPAPPPSVVPTLQVPAVTPTATPTPSVPTPRRSRTGGVPSSIATPAPTPTVVPTAVPEPVATPTPAVTEAAATPAAVTPPAGAPVWLWWAIGLTVVAIGALFAWRHVTRLPPEAVSDAAEPAAPEPAAPTPSPLARPIVATPQPDRTLLLDFRPLRLWTRGPDAHLAFELAVTNAGTAPADGVRPVIALASAGPDTAAHIAEFTANAATLPGGEPFDLRGGETRIVAGELTLPGDAMYVTNAAGRELIVPLALVSLQWRAGLSLARANAAFVIGTGDAGAPRVGPIWVDRAGLIYARLDARRFTAGPG